MACVCRHHHTVIHRHGHIGTVTPNGVVWTRADGTPIGNQPRRDGSNDDEGDSGSSDFSESTMMPERKALPVLTNATAPSTSGVSR